jgi:hypothetical protein
MSSSERVRVDAEIGDISSRASKHADLVSLIIGIAGLLASAIVLSGNQLIAAGAIVVAVLILIRAVLRGSHRGLGKSLLAVAAIAIAAVVLRYAMASDIELEAFRPDRSLGFAATAASPNDFRQEVGSKSRVLVLDLGLRESAGKTHYIKEVCFSVAEMKTYNSQTPHESISYRISVVFEGTPSSDDIAELAARYNLTEAVAVKNIVSFESTGGISDSALDIIRKSPNVRSVSFTRTGSAQAEVNFVEAKLSPKLDKAGDTAIADTNVELKKDGVAGIRAIVEFAGPGVYSLQGEIKYGESVLPLPACRVTIAQ